MAGLVSFRLSDVPLAIRTRAAARLARTNSGLPPDAAGADRLFARLLSDRMAGGDTTTRDVLHRVAEYPSDKVYWISRPAWERVMHPKNRRTC